MSDSSQTATNKPSDPVLCKMGCGFFGSATTGDCCSKCFRELQKKQGVSAEPAPALMQHQHQQQPAAMQTEEAAAKPEPMDVDEILCCKPAASPAKTEDAPTTTTAAATAAPVAKKKKKKTSYKSMMAGMMKASSPERKVETEKEKLRNVTGGGAFSKIDKI